MDNRVQQDPLYVLGHTEGERDRLAVQGRVYGPYTRQLFVEAGIQPGMRVLDAGCGAGDVSLLVAELVGPSGAVVGVDSSAEVLETARQRAALAGFSNITFVQSSLHSVSFEERFDTLVGRFVLMHLADPVAALRHLAGLVRPGGLVAFQESDLSRPPYALPMPPLLEKFGRILSTGAAPPGAPEQQMGLKLYPTFIAAGLPAPRLRMDVPLGGGPDFPGYEMFAGIIRTLLPVLEREGLLTAAEADVETLAARLRAEVVAGGGVLAAPPVVGAWTTKPARP